MKHSTAFAAFPRASRRPPAPSAPEPLGVQGTGRGPGRPRPGAPGEHQTDSSHGRIGLLLHAPAANAPNAATPLSRRRVACHPGQHACLQDCPLRRSPGRPRRGREGDARVRPVRGSSSRIPPGPRTAIAGTPTSTSRSSPPTTMTLPSTSAPPAGRSSSPACCTSGSSPTWRRASTSWSLPAAADCPLSGTAYWRCAMIARSAASRDRSTTPRRRHEHAHRLAPGPAGPPAGVAGRAPHQVEPALADHAADPLRAHPERRRHPPGQSRRPGLLALGRQFRSNADQRRAR